ncbi:MAG: histidine-type phosphatase [Terracidiphilus sp.]|jgi:4-phytase/acid phosphatase
MLTLQCASRAFNLRSLCLFFLCFLFIPSAESQTIPASNAKLELVIVLSRHGVRSPLSAGADLDKFSAAPWPKWEVTPGILTAHGYELMRIYGVWDRAKFSGEGLLASTGCADAAHVTIVADTDERTRETGKALAEGMFPGCNIDVHAQPDGTVDPLFLPRKAGIGHPDPALVTAAVAGRIGGDPANLTETYRPQLTELDRILSGCGRLPPNPHRTSIFDIPTSLKPGTAESPVAARGPLVTASTLIENLLLEYTQGMSTADTGWGCVDGATLRFIMQANVAAWDYNDRTPAFARTYASNLLDHMRSTMEQGVKGKPVPGAIGKPGDRMVILVGHDTDIATVAGALGIDWIADGRFDDSPPGGALVFELWRSPKAGTFVRVAFTTQTLEQMRNSEPLTPANPPAVAPVFVPACSGADLSCSWEGFSAAMRQATDPAFVTALP